MSDLTPVGTHESLKFIDKTIKVENLTITAGSRTLLRNANFTFAYGNRYGIIAQNGLGKSTLLDYLISSLRGLGRGPTILHLNQYSSADGLGIDTSFNIVDVVLRANVERWVLIDALRNAEVELERTESDEALDTYNQLHESLSAIGADKDESEVKRTLRGLGFSLGDLDRPFDHFSGGWKRRVLIARALYLRPDILFADEITNDLDLTAVAWLSNHLATKVKGTIVLVSHNTAFLNAVCTHMLSFERSVPPYIAQAKELSDLQGKVFEWGSTIKEYTGNYTRYKKMSTQLADTARKAWDTFDKSYRELKRSGKKVEAMALLKRRAGEGLTRPEADKKIVIDFPEIAELSQMIIEMDDVQFDWAPESSNPPVLTDLNMSIRRDDRITIVGPNGSGKTTLLNLLTGKLEPTFGEIKRHAALKTHYFNQSTVETLPLGQTPIEYLCRRGTSIDEARAALGKLGLSGASHSLNIGSLSGGQRVRVALAQFISLPAHLLIFDEVTNHLDIEAVEAVMTAICRFSGAVIIVSHDADFISAVKCRIWRCENGMVIDYKLDLNDYFEEIGRNYSSPSPPPSIKLLR